MNFSFLIKAISAAAALMLACALVQGQSLPDLIRKGDGFDRNLQAAEALEFYLEAEKLQPNDALLLVCIARQYRHLMADAAAREDKLRLGGIALAYSQRAATLAPNDSDAQLAPAITYGKMLSIQGKREQVEMTGRIKVAADKAIKLDSRNDLAWHVLGRWHQVLAGVGVVKRTLAPIIYGKLPSTTNEEAVKCFQRAIEINPHRLMHRIELGRTYAQMGQNAEARTLIEQGLAMPNVDKDDAVVKQRGRETLAKLR
jgi:tetratricopeptide (TPR) repeat protein